MKFDELNRLKRFYSEMQVDNKDERVSLAIELDEALLYIFALISTEYALEKKKTEEDYYDLLMERFGDIFDEDDLSYEDEYLNDLAVEIIDTTFRHMEEPYYRSQERALLIAQNEANTVYNHNDYLGAIEKGKKYKTWIAEMDDKTRPAHALVDSERIPINEFFIVGNEKMRYPHDFVYGSEANTVNCRCSCLYE